MSNAREPVASGFVRGQTGWRRVVRSAVVWLVAVLACCPSATYSSDYSASSRSAGIMKDATLSTVNPSRCRHALDVGPPGRADGVADDRSRGDASME